MVRVIERPITVLMVHVALMILAYFELSHLPVELSPESDFPRLSVVTSYPGASSELVAQTVTLPIEEVASTLDEAKGISSTTRDGYSVVDVQLQKNADVDLVRLNFLEKLSVVAGHFPEGTGYPEIVKYVPENLRELQGFMIFSIYGDESLMQIQKFAEDNIKPKILNVRGVACVRVSGGAKREVYIFVNRNRMQAFGVRLRNIAIALQENQYVEDAGELGNGFTRQIVLAGNGLKNLDQLGSVMVEGNGGGAYIRLCDLARIADSISTPTTIVRINGRSSVTVEVDKEPGINMLDVSSEVGAKMAELMNNLPPSLYLEKISDRSEDVRREVNELSRKALYAGLLILAVIFVFFFEKKSLLGNLVRSVVIVVSVLFSVGAGVIFLAISGIGLNVITLAALALSLGIAIDNNVVVSEAMVRESEKKEENKRKGEEEGEKGKIGETGNRRKWEPETRGKVEWTKGGNERRGAMVAKAAKQVMLPLVAATLTTVGALLPVFFLPLELKTIFIPFAETTAVVVISSLVVAFTFLPVSIMLSFSYQPSAKSPVQKNLYDGMAQGAHYQQSQPKALLLLKRVYVQAVKWLISHKKISIVFVIWLIGFPTWLLPESISYLQGSNQQSVISSQNSATGLLHSISYYLQPITNSLVSVYNSTIGSDFYKGIRPYIDYGLGGATQLFFKHVYKGELWQFGSETYLVMSVYAPQGTPTEIIDRFAKQIESILMSSQKWIKRTTTLVTSEYSSVRVDFADSVAQTSIPFIIKSELTSLASQAGGVTVSVSGYGPGFYSGGEVSPSFTIDVTGYNYESVRQIAEKIRAGILHNPRVDNVQIDRLPWQSESYEIRGYINRTYLSSFGLDIHDFMVRFSPFVSSSLDRSSILLDNRPIDLTVKFDDYFRGSTENLPDQHMDIGSEKTMKIGNAVSFEKTPLMPVIERNNRQYVRYITFDFRGPYKNGDLLANTVVKSIPVPPGYAINQHGYWFSFKPNQTIPLVLLSMLAVLIVFMITASLYESFKKPFIVILCVPMSLIGLFATFFVADANFGREGYAAVLFLIGLSVNNGILLVDKVSFEIEKREQGTRLRAETPHPCLPDRQVGVQARSTDKWRIGETGSGGAGEQDRSSSFSSSDGIGGPEKRRKGGPEKRRTGERAELIAKAASERLRPILMTTIVTIAGFLPFTISADIYSFWYSFSLGIIGGILVSSIMILLFTPVIYDSVVSLATRRVRHNLGARSETKV